MITVLFRWDIKPENEQAFKEGWSEIIHRNIEKYGALGSRLHKSENNYHGAGTGSPVSRRYITTVAVALASDDR